jgi:hypothetical protein
MRVMFFLVHEMTPNGDRDIFSLMAEPLQ